MGMNADAYRRQLSQLLPPGAAWSQEPASNLQRLLGGLGASFARVHRRSDDLWRETDPRQTYEMLDRWEAAFGLPDACSVQGSQTVLERLQALNAKVFSVGGQSHEYYIALAAILGYPGATITEYCARRHGRARMGERYGQEDWEQAWQLNLPEQKVTPRRFGISVYGERYRVWGDTYLECVISHRRQGGSIVFFSYGGI
ncbi:MAG: YmfQ family protein [Pseudomonas sp.]